MAVACYPEIKNAIQIIFDFGLQFNFDFRFADVIPDDVPNLSLQKQQEVSCDFAKLYRIFTLDSFHL